MNVDICGIHCVHFAKKSIFNSKRVDGSPFHYNKQDKLGSLTLRGHNIKMTSYERRCDVMTLHRR